MIEPTGTIRAPRPAHRTARVCDALLDGAIGAFALWVVLFHGARALGWTVDVTFAVWAVLAVTGAVAAVLLRAGGTDAADGSGSDPGEPAPRAAAGLLAVVAGGSGIVAGARVLDVPGWWVWWGLVVAVLLGAAFLVVRAPHVPGAGRWPAADPPLAIAGVVLVAVTFAALAAVVVRPDTDDVFVVNRSSWVEERGGEFPERDVLFSDEVFAITRGTEIETAIEPFIGAVARWSPWSAPTVAYLLVAPAVSAASVLALWCAARAWGAARPAVATIVGAAFLAFDAAFHTSFGNFSFGRAWQGKVVLVAVLVPLLWRHALAWGRDRQHRALVMLVLTSIAATGVSSTAAFVAPAVVALGVGCGVAGSRSGRATGALALGSVALVPPLLAGSIAVLGAPQPREVAVLLLAVGRAVVGPAGEPPPLGGPGHVDGPDAWYTVFGTGPTAIVAAVAVLSSWAFVRDRSARLAAIAAPVLVVGIFGAPGVLRWFADLGDARSIAWRIVWVLPVPLLVGATATGISAPGRMDGARVQRLRALVPAALVAAIAIAGTPVWSAHNGASVGAPAWDVEATAASAAERLLALAEPGTVVAAPEDVGGVVAIRTSLVRAHNPSSKYLRGRWVTAAFHLRARGVLSRAVEAGDLPPGAEAEVVRALDVLGVSAACVRPHLRGTVGEAGLTQAGFALVGEDAKCRYWSSGAAVPLTEGVNPTMTGARHRRRLPS